MTDCLAALPEKIRECFPTFASISAPQPHACHFKYNPVDVQWQQRACSSLGFKYSGPNGVLPCGADVQLTPPTLIKIIFGDGNCFFLTITGYSCSTGCPQSHCPTYENYRRFVVTSLTLSALSAHARECCSSHFVCVSVCLCDFGEGAVFRVETYISTF